MHRCITTCYVDGRYFEEGQVVFLDLPKDHPSRVYFEETPPNGHEDGPAKRVKRAE